MRAVCFVERMEFQASGNVFPNSMALGDVNNDGDSELVVGNTSGELTIFKGEKILQTFTKLGMITAVGIGDIFNNGQNALVVVSGDGWCRILFNSKSTDATNEQVCGLSVVHAQQIPPNTKVVLLEDVDGDGCIELVLALTDRVVRSYRWECEEITSTGNIASGSKGNIGSPSYPGKLRGLNKWEFASQIGSVTINHNADGTPCLLVAQPGGTFMKIRCPEPGTKDTGDLAPSYIDYHPLSQCHMRNPNVSTEILGDIEPPASLRKGERGMRYAVATLDGTLMLVEDEEILWSIQVDHQLFALTKLKILDGSDETGENIVACSWDGQTYILDQEKKSVRFQLEESVHAFCAGYYSTEPGKHPVPCLVYTTFTNKIYLYYNVSLPSMVTRRFTPPVNNGSEDSHKKIKLTEWVLYGI
ncbi:Uncharacterized protein GBIM_10917 [Gryllus bimaculatus]|nr:Uncharacterized protein GBIM_10917 [Gryllus bimaculatus]